MALPGSISTCALTIGPLGDWAGDAHGFSVKWQPVLDGKAQAGNIQSITWEATGQALASFVEKIPDVDAGDTTTIPLPHVDQDGFVDGTGGAFKNWTYRVEVRTRDTDGKVYLKTKFVQPVVGQSTLDFDLLKDGFAGTPIVTSTGWVTSYNGDTGAIDGPTTEEMTTVAEGLGALTETVAGLELGAASDSAVATQVEDGTLTGAAVDQRIADGITGKANTADVYSKTAADTLLSAKASAAALSTEVTDRTTADQTLATTISDYATDLNTALATKADAAATTTALAAKATTASLTTETNARTAADATLKVDPFRFDSTRGRAFKAALAKRATTPVDVLAIGASWIAGSGAGTPPVGRLIDDALGLMRAKWQPAGVAGGLGYRESYSFTAGWVTPYTYTGTTVAQTTLGLGRKLIRMNAGATVQFTSPGTAVDIVAGKGTSGGTYTYQINGGAASAPINTVNATTSDALYRIATAPGDVVKITVGSNYLYFEGVMFYNGDETKGIRMWGGGTSGYRTTDYLDGTGVSFGAISLVDPDLIITGDLIANDYGGGGVNTPITAAASLANLTTLVAAWRARCTRPPTIVLTLMPEIATANTPLDTWATFRQMAIDFAKTDGRIVLWDVAAVFGTMIGTDTYGLTAGDQAHPSLAGHLAGADSLMDVLALA